MPPAARYWADRGSEGHPTKPHNQGDAPPDRALLYAADEERRARSAHHRLAWDYYEGRHPKPLKARPGGADNNVILNLVALHAEHTIAFAAPDFPALELDDERDTQTEAALRALWKANGGAVWLSNLMLCGLLDGHVFVRILPPVLTSPLPRFVALNPANVTAYWDDGDVERVLWYEVRYAAEGERRRQDIIAPGVIDNVNWLIRDYREISASYTPGAGRWELISESAAALPPLVDWQHLPRPGAFYGRHELGNLGLIDAVNRVASDVKAILRAHASPRVVGFGFQAGTLQETAIDSPKPPCCTNSMGAASPACRASRSS